MSAYSKGTRVWLPDSVTGWVPATVTSITLPADESPSSQVTLVVNYDQGSSDDSSSRTLQFPYSVLAEASAASAAATNVHPSTPPPGQDALPPLRNPPLLESSEDLAGLSNLNEPSGRY